MRLQPRERARSAARRMSVLLPALLLAGCTTFGPGGAPLGSTMADVRTTYRVPSGEYALPDGGRRLEYATGSFGKLTYMLDFDAQGKLVKSEQVLTEANFANITPGTTRDEVRMRLGRPAEIFTVPRQKIVVWNYRFFRGDCVWFQVSIGDDAKVTEAGMGQDPVCDRGGRDPG